MAENRMDPDNPDALYQRGSFETPEIPSGDLFEDEEYGNERQRRTTPSPFTSTSTRRFGARHAINAFSAF